MGGSSYSDDLYKSRATHRAATGTTPFAHTDDISSGKVSAGVHDKLNPKGVTARESRDSVAHPESHAIGVIFDVTGSMGDVPRGLQKRLSELMALLVSKGYVAHPQILFGAIGDANSDRAPLQVGQFESGNEMEDDLSLVYIEGNGGGHNKETYELAYYFFLMHTAIDCFEKRGVKGYLFTMGDENFYPVIRKDQVLDLIGDKLQADLSTEDVVKALTERWNVFHILVEHDRNGASIDAIEPSWRGLLGERVLRMTDYNLVAELIATTIGLTEGTDLTEALKNLKDVGIDGLALNTVERALVPFSKTVAMAKAGTIAGAMPAVTEPVGAGVDRL